MARQSHNCWCPQCGLRLQDVVSGGNERVLGHQQKSSCPKPQYCHTVPQEYEGVQQRWSQVPLSWQGSGNPEGKKGTSLHSVFLADDSHGQQPILLAKFFAELGLGETQVTDAALHLLHLHLHQRQDVPLFVQLAQELFLRGA